MIGRELIGKSYQPFSVELSEAFCRELSELVQTSPRVILTASFPPVHWPAILTRHGTACLMRVWEDLAVDPLQVRLVREEFDHSRPAAFGETLSGSLSIEDVTEHFEPAEGMFQTVHLQARFVDAAGAPVATYKCSFAFPLAVSQTGRKPTDKSLGR